MQQPRKKVLFAAGGTGGHLFPAQALAEQLREENDEIELLFAGAGLSDNAYFDKTKFHYCDISSTTPFRGGILKLLKSIAILIKGVKQSFCLISKEKPDLVVGFGSFHAFPVICAAVIKKIPLVLFESNAIPGKVVRLFSKRADLTGIFFSDAKQHLNGNVVEVDIPMKNSRTCIAVEKAAAREQVNLKSDLPTLLVFGGSQGAQKINHTVLSLLPMLCSTKIPFQLLHFTGNDKTALEVSLLCEQLNIPCYVKKFEPQMQVAWSAADVVICRAGAMTLSELLDYEVPGILIPYPAASDQHQLKNALFLEKKVGGAVHLPESSLTPESLASALIPLLAIDSQKRNEWKAAIANFKGNQKKGNLGRLIKELLGNQK